MASQNPVTTILKTKLRPPVMVPGLVERPRLTHALQQNPQRPLTLVSAPAGYGKTTVVIQWLHASNTQPAWLQLDERQNDLRSFLNHFVSAIEMHIPVACVNTIALLQAAQMPPLGVLAETLSNDLDAIEEPFVLVLDDYHLVAEPAVHELLEDLLRYPPRSLHLVLITRHDPPLSLSALRARGWLTEIRQDALRFSQPEVRAVLQEMAGTTLSDTALAHLELEMEGWIVGLHLVGLLLRSHAEPEEFVLSLKGGSQQVQDYLLEEVISAQPAMIREHLLKISIVDQFCAALVEALTRVDGMTDAQMTGRDFLEEIRRSNLFVVPLDVQNEWYRFHHLFQNLLQGQLKRCHGNDEIAALHLRASEWYEVESLIEDSIDHALAIGDSQRAAEIVERHSRAMMNEDEWHVVEKWLARLPDAQVMNRPELLLARAWIHYYRLNVTAIPPILDQVDELMRKDPEISNLSGQVAFFRGFSELFKGDGVTSLKHINYALEHIPLTDHEFHAETEIIFGLAGQMQGELVRVTQTITGWLAAPSPLHPIRETHLLITLSFVSCIAGDPMGAAARLKRIRLVARANELEYPLAWCDYLDGIFHLQRGEVDLAIGFLKKALKRKHSQHARAAVDAIVALAIAYQLRGQTNQAEATQRTLVEFVNNLGPLFQPLADSCALRLAVMQGQSEAVQRWLGLPTPGVEVMLFWFEIPCVTRCRALIADGSAASLKTAQERLHEYAVANEAQHNTCQLIGMLCLQAVAYQKQGEQEHALNCAEKAARLAQPGGFVFPFVELGPPMAQLLIQLRSNKVGLELIDRLLSAFPHEQADSRRVDGIEQTAQVVAMPTSSLPQRTSKSINAPTDALTNRELETLELLSQRLYDKEIAKVMSISIWTVKSHVKHIYEKLHVNNRRQAVARAEELGLLAGK
ncbi:LuxR C-terminal-related transcriptional regulator [Novipirellula herctigrandis]|uniref:LuxR C-terminal-related transcriptional regulator n=1 Tax=Novipirellula herctigrandis TaxID=2527986 RepID=UPI003AF33C0C